jgi:hypothetical protein
MRRSHLLFLASGFLLGLMVAGGIQLARQGIGRRTLASLPAQKSRVEADHADSEAIDSAEFRGEKRGPDSAAAELRKRRGNAPKSQNLRSPNVVAPEAFHVIPPNDSADSLSARRFEPMPKWAASQHWINGQRYYIVPLN